MSAITTDILKLLVRRVEARTGQPLRFARAGLPLRYDMTDSRGHVHGHTNPDRLGHVNPGEFAPKGGTGGLSPAPKPNAGSGSSEGKTPLANSGGFTLTNNHPLIQHQQSLKTVAPVQGAAPIKTLTMAGTRPLNQGEHNQVAQAHAAVSGFYAAQGQKALADSHSAMAEWHQHQAAQPRPPYPVAEEHTPPPGWSDVTKSPQWGQGQQPRVNPPPYPVARGVRSPPAAPVAQPQYPVAQGVQPPPAPGAAPAPEPQQPAAQPPAEPQAQKFRPSARTLENLKHAVQGVVNGGPDAKRYSDYLDRFRAEAQQHGVDPSEHIGRAMGVQTRSEIVGQQQATPSAQPIASPQPAEAAKSAPPAKPMTFRTEQGSTYTFTNGRTQRTKTPHLGHDTKDVGLKEQSELTHFVSPQDAQKIGMWNSVQGLPGPKKLLVRGNQAHLVNWNPQTNQYHTSGTVQLHDQPAQGLSPLELWKGQDDPHFPGDKVYGNNHPGNAIVDMAAVEPTSSPQTAPDQTSPVQPQPSQPPPQTDQGAPVEQPVTAEPTPQPQQQTLHPAVAKEVERVRSFKPSADYPNPGSEGQHPDDRADVAAVLAGTKPAALVADLPGVHPFLEAARAKGLDVLKDGDDFFVGPQGTAGPIAKLRGEMMADQIPMADYHRQIGKWLGYSPEQIEDFVARDSKGTHEGALVYDPEKGWINTPKAPAEAPAPTVKQDLTVRPQPQHGRPQTIDHDAHYLVPPHELHVDPARFQYKDVTDKSHGVTDELKSIRQVNPDMLGVVSVWRDPATGQDFVVNGHHRHELVSRTGYPHLPVRYLNASSAQEARAIGALINIAEGRGTAVDAAKFLRDTGQTADAFEKRGISLKGKVAADAVPLTRLNDRIFGRVARGQMDPAQAIAIGKHLTDPQLQDQLAGLLDQREEAGKDTPLRLIEEMAREMAETPKAMKGEGEPNLFGDIAEPESLFQERNELKAHARAELAKEVNDFLAVSSKRRAEKVGKAGNVLDPEQNRKIAAEAERIADHFGQQVNLKGPISDTLNTFAGEYAAAKGKKAKDAVKQRLVDALRDVTIQHAGLAPAGLGPDLPGSGAAGAPQPAAEPAPISAVRGRGTAEPAGLKPRRTQLAPALSALGEQVHNPNVSHPVVQKLRASIADPKSSLPWGDQERYRRALDRATQHMPSTALDRINQNLKGAKFHQNWRSIGVAAVEAARKDPKYATGEALKKLESVLADAKAGKYAPGGAYVGGVVQEIHVDGDYNEMKSAAGPYTGPGLKSHEVYAHELGHAIDGPDFALSGQYGWKQAWQSEIGTQDDKGPRLTKYAATSAQEGFAEFCRLLYASGVPTETIQKDFPQASTFFKAQGLWPAEKGGAEQRADEVFDQRVELTPDGSHIDTLRTAIANPLEAEGALARQDAARSLLKETLQQQFGSAKDVGWTEPITAEHNGRKISLTPLMNGSQVFISFGFTKAKRQELGLRTQFQLTHRPGDMDPGSMDFMRRLFGMVRGLAQSGTDISYAADKTHREFYHRMLPKFGYQLKSSMAPGGRYETDTWTPAESPIQAAAEPFTDSEVRELAATLPDQEEAEAPAQPPLKVTSNSWFHGHQKAVNEFFGKPVDDKTLAGLVGATGGTVTVTPTKWEGQHPGLSISVKNPQWQANRILYRDAQGKLICHNSDIRVYDTGKGLGTEIFSSQVRNMQTAGVSRIEGVAGGRPGDSKMNGYSTWAKLGYDGPLPPPSLAKLPAEWRDCKSVLDVLAKPGGDKWWEANGEPFRAAFDLTPGSRSLRKLNLYLADKGLPPVGQQKAAVQYERKALAVADRVRAGTITPSEGRRLLNQLEADYARNT